MLILHLPTRKYKWESATRGKSPFHKSKSKQTLELLKRPNICSVRCKPGKLFLVTGPKHQLCPSCLLSLSPGLNFNAESHYQMLYPSFIILHNCWLRYNFIGYNLKEGASRREGAVFLVGAASPRLSLIWLLMLAGGAWLAGCPGPALPRGSGTGTGSGSTGSGSTGSGGRASSPAASGLSSPAPGLGKQLLCSSQVTAIFNFEAKEISIVEACTYPAFPRQNTKANPLFPFKTRAWRFALFSKAGGGKKPPTNPNQKKPNHYFSRKFKRKIRCFKINNAPF